MSDDLVERLRRDSSSSYMCQNCDEGLKEEAAAALEASQSLLARRTEALERIRDDEWNDGKGCLRAMTVHQFASEALGLDADV